MRLAKAQRNNRESQKKHKCDINSEEPTFVFFCVLAH